MTGNALKWMELFKNETGVIKDYNIKGNEICETKYTLSKCITKSLWFFKNLKWKHL